MYKTKLQRSVIGENISLSVVKEGGEDSVRYALLRIGLFGRNAYAVCVLGEEYALETLGYDGERAEGIFDTIVREGVSVLHVSDVIADLRRECEDDLLCAEE